jgi:hypothetical protein
MIRDAPVTALMSHVQKPTYTEKCVYDHRDKPLLTPRLMMLMQSLDAFHMQRTNRSHAEPILPLLPTARCITTMQNEIFKQCHQKKALPQHRQHSSRDPGGRVPSPDLEEGGLVAHRRETISFSRIRLLHFEAD